MSTGASHHTFVSHSNPRTSLAHMALWQMRQPHLLERTECQKTPHTAGAGTSTPSVAAPPATSSEAVNAVPAAAEQQALDATYKGGDSPYDISKVSPSVCRIKGAPFCACGLQRFVVDTQPSLRAGMSCVIYQCERSSRISVCPMLLRLRIPAVRGACACVCFMPFFLFARTNMHS